MDALQRVLNPLVGSQGVFHFASAAHRSDDCPCKLVKRTASIWTAAETNDLELVESKVMNNLTLAAKLDAYGYSPLHYAAQHNHIKIVEFLISKGADPDANRCGATALHRAAFAGSYESCDLLLKAHANPNAIDSSFRDHGTPLHKAARAGNEKMIELLLKYGADASIVDASGQTAINLFKVMKVKSPTEVAGTENEIVNGNGSGRADDSQRQQQPPSDDIEKVANSSTDNTSVSQSQYTARAGMNCSKCKQVCLSFTRLATGELICTSCKYSM